MHNAVQTAVVTMTSVGENHHAFMKAEDSTLYLKVMLHVVRKEIHTGMCHSDV